MKSHLLIPICLLLTLLAGHTQIARVVVHGFGTNQLEFVASSLQTNTYYLILARSNNPFAYWATLTGLLSDTNYSVTTRRNLSDNQAEALQGLTTKTLAYWTFAIGPGSDHDGDGLPDVYEDLACRTDPFQGDDGYGDPDADGWVNIQEMQNSTDPLHWGKDLPKPSNLNVTSFTNGTVKLTWSQWHLPDYFLVLKSERTLKRGPRPGVYPQQHPKGFTGTNLQAFWQRQRQSLRGFRPEPGDPYRPEYEISPAKAIAKIVPMPGQHDFTYIETNAFSNTFNTPLYQIRSHYTPPLSSVLEPPAGQTLRQSLLYLSVARTTNGYSLRADRPIPYARYLLLVRDAAKPRWRACGYFISGTNSAPVNLHVDERGMMRHGQAPIALSNVKFAPVVANPQFAAGWGEDSDGDGLPDIYEALVTQTDPARADTGNTGFLDGYKDPDTDQSTNLEEFRRRTDPFHPNPIPATVELLRPTLSQLRQALASERLLTDLTFEPELQIRKPGRTEFEGANLMDEALYSTVLAKPKNSSFEFDARVIWHVPKPRQIQTGYSGP